MQLANEVTLLDSLADVIDERLHVMPVAQKRCPACIRNGLCNVAWQSALRYLESPLGASTDAS